MGSTSPALPRSSKHTPADKFIFKRLAPQASFLPPFFLPKNNGFARKKFIDNKGILMYCICVEILIFRHIFTIKSFAFGMPQKLCAQGF